MHSFPGAPQCGLGTHNLQVGRATLNWPGGTWLWDGGIVTFERLC